MLPLNRRSDYPSSCLGLVTKAWVFGLTLCAVLLVCTSRTPIAAVILLLLEASPTVGLFVLIWRTLEPRMAHGLFLLESLFLGSVPVSFLSVGAWWITAFTAIAVFLGSKVKEGFRELLEVIAKEAQPFSDTDESLGALAYANDSQALEQSPSDEAQTINHCALKSVRNESRELVDLENKFGEELVNEFMKLATPFSIAVVQSVVAGADEFMKFKLARRYTQLLLAGHDVSANTIIATSCIGALGLASGAVYCQTLFSLRITEFLSSHIRTVTMQENGDFALSWGLLRSMLRRQLAPRYVTLLIHVCTGCFIGIRLAEERKLKRRSSHIVTVAIAWAHRTAFEFAGLLGRRFKDDKCDGFLCSFPFAAIAKALIVVELVALCFMRYRRLQTTIAYHSVSASE